MARAPWRRHDDEDVDGGPRDATRRTTGTSFWEMVRLARTTTDPTEIEHLLGLGEVQIDIVLASRVDLGPALIRRLASNRDDDVAQTALSNQLISAEAIREIVRAHPLRASSRLVRRELVSKPDATRWMLRRSAHSPFWDVRRNVAAHPSTPPRQLVRLSKDRTWSVRAAVAANPAAPARAMSRLLIDQPAVRLDLATNPSLPTPFVEVLLRDPDIVIAGLAAGHPTATPDALEDVLERRDTLPWVRARIAKSPRCPHGRGDEILTWVALGGAGPGDATFDPRTCSVNPIDATRPVADFIASITPSLSSPLWPVRLAMLKQARALEAPVHRTAARDTSPVVRRRAADFRSRGGLLELSGDRDALVRSAAQRLGGRVGRVRPKKAPIVIGCVVAAVLLAGVARRGSTSESDSTTAAQQLATSPGSTGESGILTFDRPGFTALVTDAGSSVLLRIRAVDDTLTIEDVRGSRPANDGTSFPVTLRPNEVASFVIDFPDELQVVVTGSDSTPDIYPLEIPNDG